MTQQPAPLPFAIHTDPGNGQVFTERYATAEERLARLWERAQGYFPGARVPIPPGVDDTATYLAQLLGFFLMIDDGSVTLVTLSTDFAEHEQAGISGQTKFAS